MFDTPFIPYFVLIIIILTTFIYGTSTNTTSQIRGTRRILSTIAMFVIFFSERISGLLAFMTFIAPNLSLLVFPVLEWCIVNV